MPDEKGLETDEEARERVAEVRSTQIFGDTPTDPTIGDAVVVAHDEEAATASTAAVDAAAEDGDEEAADLSVGEAKRQNEALSADDVDAGASDQDDDTDDDGDVDDDDRKAADVISDIESASSVEEVDTLAHEDSRVTVQRAAEKRRDELS